MRKTQQTRVVIIGVVVLILVIGTLSLPSIVNFFAPAGTTVEQGPTRLGGHVAEPPGKKDEKKMAARRSSGEAEKPPPAGARYSANPLPRGASPASSESTATYTAPHKRLQVEERDPTLEEEVVSPSLAEQYAQEQDLQQVAAMEDMRQRDFDPTVATPNLTAEQLAAVEEEIQESLLPEESRQPMLQDIQPDGYGVALTPAER